MVLLKAIAITIASFGFLIADGQATDVINGGSWSQAHDNITMDLVYNDGMYSSGTMRCPTVKACYLSVLRYEYRMGHITRTQCSTITIKRNGRVVWHRKYAK